MFKPQNLQPSRPDMRKSCIFVGHKVLPYYKYEGLVCFALGLLQIVEIDAEIGYAAG
jgi:hypothetical protein